MFMTLELLRDRRRLVDVELHELDVGVVAGHLLEHRADHAAGAAPLGPEVHQDLAGGLDDLGVEVVL